MKKITIKTTQERIGKRYKKFGKCYLEYLFDSVEKGWLSLDEFLSIKKNYKFKNA